MSYLYEQIYTHPYLSLFAVLLLSQTNPGEEAHKAAVRDRLTAYLQKEIKDHNNDKVVSGMATLFGGYVMDRIIDGNVSRDSYILFSTTKFTHEGKSRVIGIGVMGNVFLSSKINEALEKRCAKNDNMKRLLSYCLLFALTGCKFLGVGKQCYTCTS